LCGLLWRGRTGGRRVSRRYGTALIRQFRTANAGLYLLAGAKGVAGDATISGADAAQHAYPADLARRICLYAGKIDGRQHVSLSPLPQQTPSPFYAAAFHSTCFCALQTAGVGRKEGEQGGQAYSALPWRHRHCRAFCACRRMRMTCGASATRAWRVRAQASTPGDLYNKAGAPLCAVNRRLERAALSAASLARRQEHSVRFREAAARTTDMCSAGACRASRFFSACCLCNGRRSVDRQGAAARGG